MSKYEIFPKNIYIYKYLIEIKISHLLVILKTQAIIEISSRDI